MYEEIREKIIEIGRRAYHRGHVSGCSGNISARTPDGRGLVIKASGCSFADMGAGDILFVDWEGAAFDCSDMAASPRRPSIETALHEGLYRLDERTLSVVHLHSPYTTALSFLTGEIPLVVQETRETFKRVPVVPHLPAGSPALADAIGKAFSRDDIRAAVIGEHGPVAIGKSPDEAFDNLDMLEHNCRIAVILRELRAAGK